MSCHLPIPQAAIIAAALAATILFAPSSASAEQRPIFVYAEPTAIRAELVSFARLDLAKQRDQKRIRRKVSAAIERVCLRDIGRDGLQDRDYYACENNAWDAASPRIAQALASATDLASKGAPIAVTAIRISAR